MNTEQLTVNAEKQISIILAKLEEQTGSIVDRIELRDTEITSIRDDRPKWQRSLIIELKRLPGTCWNV